MKRGKKYVEAAKAVDRATLYDAPEAISLVKKAAVAKFDETIEVHIRTGCDGRHADQQIRGAVVLPHGTGKKVRVLVFAKDAKAEEAKAAGADFVGAEELIPKKFIIRQKEIKKDKPIFRREGLKKTSVKKNEEKFESFALKIDRKVSKDELLSKFNFIKNSLEFGQIVRAKGIVETNNGKEQFDYTLSEISMEKIVYRGESVISFIGTNLNKDKIKKFFL